METIIEIPKCAYCGEKSLCLEEHNIWLNGNKVRRMFCDDNCAIKYQMGAEG